MRILQYMIINQFGLYQNLASEREVEKVSKNLQDERDLKSTIFCRCPTKMLLHCSILVTKQMTYHVPCIYSPKVNNAANNNDYSKKRPKKDKDNGFFANPCLDYLARVFV